MQEKLSKNAIILIIEKLKHVLGAKNDTELGEILGVRQNTISSWKSRGTVDYALIIAKCDNIDLNWLFDNYPLIDQVRTEEIQKFVTKNAENTTILEGGEKGGEKGGIPNVQKTPPNELAETISEQLVSDIRATYKSADKVFALRTDRIIDRQVIPIYDMEAVAGLVPLFADSYSQQVVEVIETSLIPKCDGGLRIVGDSMYPLLKSGDVIFYRQINDIRSNLIWGEMYLVSFDMDGEEYVAVKYLNKSDLKDHVVLTSYNQHHAPLEIHLGRIRALALIKASLRINSIK